MPVIFDDEVTGQEDWQRAIRESIEAYREGDLGRALDRIENISDTSINDPRFFTHRASLYLAAGSVEDAASDINRALGLDSNNADALSLQAIVAIALNDNDRALTLAQQAVAADAQSASAQIAMSYAQQALFDLEGARATLESAVANHPDNALVWARLSELHLSFGDLGDALDAARTSAAHEPNLVRSQTVLGYAYLMQVRTRQAKEAFQRAIELDQGDPVPRLGLGLAMIREGDLAEGRREIEVASSLDPGDAVVRSYLGKAYFEEKKPGLDEREYTMAKEVDPNDPTPYFYDAIARQTTNRPVEALESLQEAIELNDNRAVYRSKLLLDSDLAARSASQARVYSDLGFQDRALVEGWTSVNTDPTNYSAHRFLADSYAVLPRHEIARVSELFQSQMLQPINTTPIQPRLGESNLFLISSGGPAALSFNEFNPLFNRNGFNVQASGLGGENGLGSGEAVVAGIYDKVSFSVGYSQFQSDGWERSRGDEVFTGTAFQEDKIANAFFQVELTPAASIQFEYRYRDVEQGDLQQKFFEEVFVEDQLSTRESQSARVGGRYAFSPSSILLASYIYSDADETLDIPNFFGPGTSFGVVSPQKANGFEAQYLFRSQYVDVTSGVGYFDIDSELFLTIELPFGTQEQMQENVFDHVNLYAYANVKPLDTLTVTVGGSLDRLKGDVVANLGDMDDFDQFNPKFGVIWNPHPTTTVRASAFKALKRTLITDQTLEPTQVGGFNQFYDEADLTESWRYGGGIDQRFGSDVFAGIEYSERDLTVPLISALDGMPVEAPWHETLARVYAFATPHDWVGVRVNYIRERFERVAGLGLGFAELETWRLPLGVGFFHPSGLSVSVTGTYWNQKGQFEAFFGPPNNIREGTSDFWLVDLAVNYRLPKRYGFLSVGATNLFDEQFQYFEVELGNITIQPTRTVFVKFTLAVP